ncbi:MAG: hypothetical protein IJK62_07795 [Bacteroidales bacterium]|nr:hypothetical protein [Bacteroidales bacterium]
MKTIHYIIAIVSLIVALLTSCNKKEGCTNPNAKNYDPSAKVDDGSCIFDAPDSTLNAPVDIRAAWIGEYACTKIQTTHTDTENPRTDTSQTILKVYAVNSCDNLLHIIEASIGHNCYVVCESDNTFRDTLINGDAQNRPIVRGCFDGNTVNIEYIWGQEGLHIIFSGTKTQAYEFTAADYRDGWIGNYEGKIRYTNYSIDTTCPVSFSVEKYMDCDLRLSNIVSSVDRSSETIKNVYEDGKIEDNIGNHLVAKGTIFTDSISVYFVDGTALGSNPVYAYYAKKVIR